MATRRRERATEYSSNRNATSTGKFLYNGMNKSEDCTGVHPTMNSKVPLIGRSRTIKGKAPGDGIRHHLRNVSGSGPVESSENPSRISGNYPCPEGNETLTIHHLLQRLLDSTQQISEKMESLEDRMSKLEARHSLEPEGEGKSHEHSPNLVPSFEARINQSSAQRVPRVFTPDVRHNVSGNVASLSPKGYRRQSQFNVKGGGVGSKGKLDYTSPMFHAKPDLYVDPNSLGTQFHGSQTIVTIDSNSNDPRAVAPMYDGSPSVEKRIEFNTE